MSAPPRVARALARILLPRAYRDVALGDLDEAWRGWVSETRTPLRARLWYWRQVLASIGAAVVYETGRVRGAQGSDGMMGEIRATVRAARMLLRRPGFAGAVMLTLGLGIGGSTAMWSVVDGVLLEPLALPEPERLVAVWSEQNGQLYNNSGPNLLDLEAGVRAFEGLYPFIADRVVFEGPDGRRRQLEAAQVGHDAFEILGVQPELGRGFRPEDEDEGAAAVVVLSNALWTTQWGGAPDVVGRTVSLGGRSTEVVGVLPAGVEIPMLEGSDLFIPFARPIDRLGRDMIWLGAVARVRPDRTLEAAQAEAEGVWEGLRQAYPDALGDRGVAVVPLRSYLVEDVRSVLWVLLGATGLLLMIASVNAGGLLFIRGRARETELAVRAALGAGRGRVAIELLREGVVLLAGAAVLGVVIAVLGQDLLLRLAPPDLPRIDRVRLDGGAIVVSLVVSLGIGFAVIAGSSLSAARHAGPGRMLSGSRGEVSRRGGRRLRGIAVAIQAALATVLLVGAAHFVRSLDRLASTDPGYRIDDVVMARVELPGTEFTDRADRAEAFRRMERFAEALPGVGRAGFSMLSPMRAGRINYEVAIDGLSAGDPGSAPSADLHVVSPGYAEALEIPVIQGRTFVDEDAAGEERVAVVSEELARTLWPGVTPVGRTIGFITGESRLPSTWWRVIGVVGDVRFQSLDDDTRGTLYVNMHQLAQYTGTLVASVEAGEVAGVSEALRAGLPGEAAGLAEPEVFTMRSSVARVLAPSRFQTTLILVFAVMALTLAALGMYGSVAWSVGQRRAEIGLRLVLGAEPRAVVRQMLREGLLPAVLGLVAGTTVALALGRVVESLLFGVGPRDPLAVGGAGVVLLLVATVACGIPAARAVRVHPAESLREG